MIDMKFTNKWLMVSRRRLEKPKVDGGWND
jgi:hypothetical protein